MPSRSHEQNTYCGCGDEAGNWKNSYETVLGVYICEVLCKYVEYNLFIAKSDGNIFKLLSYLI